MATAALTDPAIIAGIHAITTYVPLYLNKEQLMTLHEAARLRPGVCAEEVVSQALRLFVSVEGERT